MSNKPIERKTCCADVDAVVLQIREHVKTMEAKEKAHSEKRRLLARKQSMQTSDAQ